MIIPAVSDTAFSVLGFPIYRYGITMAVGMFASLFTANYLSDYVIYKKDIFIEYSPMILIFGVLGARLYFCLLNFSYYSKDIIDIFNFRQGGLSIHGGMIGGIIALLYIAKKEKIDFLKILDCSACAILLGQSIGRWGNYFNCEAYGLPVESQTWGLFVPVEHRLEQFMDYSLYHPAFLYESVLDLIAFGILLWAFHKFKNYKDGVVFFLYLFIYSLIRFFIEGIRVDSALSIHSVHFPQIVSVILVIVGICGLYKCLYKKENI